jgi:uncharacterized membrane protein YedE/YeeE
MKRHSTDMVSLVFGLLFVAVAVWWMVGDPAHVGVTAGWLAVGVLGAVGLIGLATAATRRRAAPAGDPAPPADFPFGTDSTPRPDAPTEADLVPHAEPMTSPDPTQTEPGPRS